MYPNSSRFFGLSHKRRADMEQLPTGKTWLGYTSVCNGTNEDSSPLESGATPVHVGSLDRLCQHSFISLITPLLTCKFMSMWLLRKGEFFSFFFSSSWPHENLS